MVDGRDARSDGLRGYRARLVDASGTVVNTVDVMAQTESEALQQVTALGRYDTVEQWERGRLIVRVPRSGS